MKPKFNVIYSDEAADFMESQSQKVRDKIYYNIDKSRYFTNNELFKNLEVGCPI